MTCEKLQEGAGIDSKLCREWQWDPVPKVLSKESVVSKPAGAN